MLSGAQKGWILRKITRGNFKASILAPKSFNRRFLIPSNITSEHAYTTSRGLPLVLGPRLDRRNMKPPAALAQDPDSTGLQATMAQNTLKPHKVILEGVTAEFTPVSTGV